jgi:flagellar protein FliS
MAVANPYNRMLETKVMTATKEELTLMLYDGALKFCNQAIIAVERKENDKAHSLIMRVEDIIREFQITLNRSYERSAQLDLLYDYIYRRLVDATMQKSVEILSEVRDLIRDFRDMWKEAMRQAK